MVRFLLDTNILIYAMNKRPESVFNKLKSLSVGEVAVSSITIAELQYGASKSSKVEHNRRMLQEFLAPFELLDWPQQATEIYGTIRTNLERSGKIIGAMDMMIASHALYSGLILVTNNTKHFKDIPDLRLENWVN